MGETEFLTLAESSLNAIEVALDQCADDLDFDCLRNGNVLEIELIDSASKVIVNIQAAMQELWVAARSGGFHFQYDGQQWRDTRDGGELFAALSKMISSQGGVQVELHA
ncbi:MAG: iron donor protein CyaY [Burkholderiales bacterium]|nr:iron donor protein CyaY [Burkholderiales bacterium]